MSIHIDGLYDKKKKSRSNITEIPYRHYKGHTVHTHNYWTLHSMVVAHLSCLIGVLSL